MIDLTGLRRRGRGQPEIIILSLIDIMMVLVIFLLTTASASRETGLLVQRPRAASGQALESESILIGVGADGELSFDGHRVDRFSVRGLVAQRLARKPEAGVVLVADRRTPAEILVSVMDEAQLGGAKRIAVASQREER